MSKKRIGKYRTIDLFAGVGGVRIAFENVGCKTVFANDFDRYCKVTYDLNFKHTKLNTDSILDIKSEMLKTYEYEILLGGFPCQVFSVAGYREGFKDKKGRGNLFFEIARIIQDTKPMAFMLENVKNLRHHDHGKTYRIIYDTLTKGLGYHVDSRILNSMRHGNIPQNRERIFIVGFKDKENFDNFKFPEETPLIRKVKHYLSRKVDDKYYYNGKPLYKRIKKDIKDKDKVYQWRRKYIRENKSGVCPTLTANMGEGGHNVPIIRDKKGVRKLTPQECANLQGFPDWYQLPSELADSRLYKQFGNSVTIPVVQRLAENLVSALNNVTPKDKQLTIS